MTSSCSLTNHLDYFAKSSTANSSYIHRKWQQRWRRLSRNIEEAKRCFIVAWDGKELIYFTFCDYFSSTIGRDGILLIIFLDVI
jgi:hypothetical protein